MSERQQEPVLKYGGCCWLVTAVIVHVCAHIEACLRLWSPYTVGKRRATVWLCMLVFGFGLGEQEYGMCLCVHVYGSVVFMFDYVLCSG